MLASQSAVTDPFADFSVNTGLLQLEITRTYMSNDWAYSGGPAGAFGSGWHHNWEAWLTCGGNRCTVELGGQVGYQFGLSGTAPLLDNTETWQIYLAYSDQILRDDNQNILARRPSGEWILFLTDGREMHFGTACDACPGVSSDPYCQDAATGGKARLVKVVDERGSSVQVSYDRPGGVLFGLSDDLGHSLKLQSDSACTDGLASSLQYDGAKVASYGYTGLDLTQAKDADGALLRSYAYDTSGTGRLQVVSNEAGDTVASFSYDGTARATGVVDKHSRVSVNYGVAGSPQVTEQYGNTSATSVRTLDQDGHATSISDGCACGSARILKWTNRRLTCVADSLGHVTWQDFDPEGRLTHRVEYSSATGCPTSAPTSLDPAASREEWRSYIVTKHIATGVDLALDRVTSITRTSTASSPTPYAAESLSYDPAPPQGVTDPGGYTCQEAPLPTGAAPCRRIESGYTYDKNGNVRFERHATFYSYDARGRLVQTLGPLNLDYPSPNDVTPLEQRSYWSDTESLARRGRLMQVKRYASPTATPLVTSYDYDAFGAYLITQPSGGLTTVIKDGRGRPTFVIGPDGQQTETRYHDGLDPRLRILPSGASVRLAYDGTGRLAGVEYLSGDPEASGASPTLGWGEYYQYDDAGNRVHTERRDGSGTVTWQQDQDYDVQHRLVKDTNPESPTTAKTRTFDPSGFLGTVTDEEGRTTKYTPDGINRVKTVTRAGVDATGAPVSLDVAQYIFQNYADSLSQVGDGNGRNTTYAHDDFGRSSSMSSNDLKGGQMRSAYDARGNLLQRADSYVTVSYEYDGLDRVLTVTASNSVDGSSLSYTYVYDEAPYQGYLTRVVEPDRTVRYAYDPMGRFSSETIQENGVSAALVTQYSYDVNGAISGVVYPSGFQVQFPRDPATREITQVVNSADGTRYADQIAHLPGGPAKSLVFGNGLALSQTFNRRYEPVVITSGPVALGYGMTPAGDVGSVTDTSRVLSGCQRNTSRSFGYDFLDRLTDSPFWLSYGYDGAGNRTSEVVEGSSATYTYSPATDRVQDRWVAGVRTQAYGYDYGANLSAVGTYDASGKTVTQAVCFRHDPLGRMTSFGYTSAASVGPDSTSCTRDTDVTQPLARFKYEARGRRIARQDPATGQWTYVVSDPSGNPLSELALVGGSWTRVRDYVWLDGRPLAQVEYPTSSTAFAYYLHLDHLGRPRAMSNSSGQLVWNTFAKPYGDLAEKTATDPLSGRVVVTNLRLPGQYDERLLGSLGLQGPYYNWNRWYLPGVGRYLELDPVALRGKFNSRFGVNWYGYAAANPIRYVDPLGLYDCFYSISAHQMTCYPNDPTNPTFDSDHYVSGQNSPTCPDCRDNPARVNVRDFGPIPPGPYNIGDRLTPGGHRRRLTPSPSNRRWGFQTHGCGNPNTCSNGCIAATDSATRDLFDDLMDLEDNNTVVVEP